VGQHGQITINSEGACACIANRAGALDAGDRGEDVFTCTVTDGITTSIPDIRMTVLGKEDVGIITRDIVRNMDRFWSVTAKGAVSVSDPDAGEEGWEAVSAQDLKGGFGTFTFDADSGVWTCLRDISIYAPRNGSATDVPTVGGQTQDFKVRFHFVNEFPQPTDPCAPGNTVRMVRGRTSLTEDLQETATGNILNNDFLGAGTKVTAVDGVAGPANRAVEGDWGTLQFFNNGYCV